MSPIKELNVFGSLGVFFDELIKWLPSAQSINFKLFDQINVKMETEFHDGCAYSIMSLVTLCQYANTSKLELESSSFHTMGIKDEWSSAGSSVFSCIFCMGLLMMNLHPTVIPIATDAY